MTTLRRYRDCFQFKMVKVGFSDGLGNYGKFPKLYKFAHPSIRPYLQTYNK